MKDTDCTLHIYSQPYEHADAKIVGNLAGLSRLALALTRTIVRTTREKTASEETTGTVFATDGEGYEIKIMVMPDEPLMLIDGEPIIDPKWAEYPPHYCDRGYDDDTHHPEEVGKAIKILEELKKGGHGGFDGVNALTLAIEALKGGKT